MQAIDQLQLPDAPAGASAPVLVDFFSGCGGTSAGFKAAGMRVIFGIDNDPTSGLTFVRNFPEAKFIKADIRDMDVTDIQSALPSSPTPIVFAACAPCQPFSKQRRGSRKGDDRAPLLLEFLRFVRFYLPDCVFIENVPGLQSGLDTESPFQEFQTSVMEELGYNMSSKVVSSAAYGVPQKRQRLVALASRLGTIDIPPPTYGPGTSNPAYSTVKEWISDLPPLKAGEEVSSVPNHRAAGLSPLNLKRIRATREGGGREDWPEELLPKCHSNGYEGHIDVYGRMRWDAPASALTTRCISYSNGRFGHPDQDRAISVREAACLQTFPPDFIFDGNWESMGRQIGNAVPVKLAEVFGTHVIRHIREAMGS